MRWRWSGGRARGGVRGEREAEGGEGGEGREDGEGGEAGEAGEGGVDIPVAFIVGELEKVIKKLSVVREDDVADEGGEGEAVAWAGVGGRGPGFAGARR